MMARTLESGGGTPLGRSVVLSLLVHGGLAAIAMYATTRPVPIRPPVYRVNLVGAPEGPKNIGVVNTPPSDAPVAAAEAPSGIERPPMERAVPTPTKAPPRPTPKATPTPSRTAKAGQEGGARSATKTQAPRAGSATGGRGADVATVRTEGIDFPAPAYLNNIVRQVELRFNPDERMANRALRAEVSFLIHRDGSVSDIRMEQGSGVYRFDLDARSAVEAASRSFGALPPEWTDEVLRVYFTFTPKGMR